MARCSGINAAGDRCGSIAITGSSYCYGHHPDRAADRRRAATKGGQRGGRGRPSTLLVDIQTRLDELVEQVLAGELDASKASVCGQLINYKTAAIRTAKAKEQEELVERMEQIEAHLEQKRRSA